MDKVWQRHEIQLSDSDDRLKVSLETSENSLNSNAQDMHKKFLLNLPHLIEVQKIHENLVTNITIDLEETKMKNREINTMDEIITEFGGKDIGSGITLQFPSGSPENLVFQTTYENDIQVARIISPDVFGGLLRTFKLPPGKEIETINWDNGIIELLFI
jgi:hypothetical protein